MADSEHNEGRQSNTSDGTDGSNNTVENSAVGERQVIDERQERQPLGQSMSAPPTCGAHASQVSLAHIPELRRNLSNPSEEERRVLTSSESASTSGYSSTDLLDDGNLERSSDVFMPPAERKDDVGRKDSDKVTEPEGPSPCSIEVAEITARIERNDTETSEITPDGVCSPVAKSASDDSDSKSKDLCLSIPSIDATSSSKQTSDGANVNEFSTISVASSESFQTGVVSFSDDTPLNVPKPIARCVTPDSSTLLADSVPDNSLGVFEARTETTTESLCVGCAAQSSSDIAADGLSLSSHDPTIVNLSTSISTSVSIDNLGNSSNSFITGNSNAINQGTEQTTVDSSVTEEIFACTASDVPFPSMIDYSNSASVCSEAATQTEDYSDVTEPEPLFNISPSPSRVVLRGDINGAFSLDMTYGDGEESTLFFPEPEIEEPEIEPSPCSVEVAKIIEGSGNSRDSFTPPTLKLEPWVLPHNGKNTQTGVQAFSDATPTNVPRPVVMIPVCPEENSPISPKQSSSGNLTTLGADSAFTSCGVRPKTRQFGGSGEECLDPSSTDTFPHSTHQEVIKLSSYNSGGARRRRDSFTRESHRDHPYAHVEEPFSRRRSLNEQAIIKTNVEKFFKELKHTQVSELRHNEIQENTISSTIAASDDSCDALDGRRSRTENRNAEESTAASLSRFQSDFAPSASIINHYFDLDTEESWPYGRVSVSPSIDIDPEIEEGIRALANFNPDLVRPLSRIITPENVMPDGLQPDHQPSSHESSPIQQLDELGAVAGSIGDNRSVKDLMSDTHADKRTETLASVDASGDFVYLGRSASDEPPCASSSPGGAVSSSEMSSGFARSEDGLTRTTEYPVEMGNLGASDASGGEPRCALDQETLDGVRRRIQNMGITISDFLKYFHISSAEFRPRPRTARNLLPGDPFIEGVIRWFVADVGYEYAEQAYVGFKWGPSTTRESSSQTSTAEVEVQQPMSESEPPQTAEGQSSQQNTRNYIWSLWAPLVPRGSMPRMNAGPSFYTPFVPGHCSSYPFLPVPPLVTSDQIRCTLPTVQVDHSEVSNEPENVQHVDQSPSILLTTGQITNSAVNSEIGNVRKQDQSSSVLLPTGQTSPSAAVHESENGRQQDRSSSVLLPTGQITPTAIANEAESARQQDQSCSVPQLTEQQETLADVSQSEGVQIARQEISEMLVEEQENMPPNESGEAADQNRNRTPEAKKKSPLIVRSRSRTK